MSLKIFNTLSGEKEEFVPLTGDQVRMYVCRSRNPRHHDPVALRQFFMGSHYRSPMDFSRGGLEEAGKAMERIFETLDRLQRSLRLKVDTVADAALMASFCQEMDDDFNMPRALALIFDEVRALNRLLGEKKQKGIENRAAGLRVMCETLGLQQAGYWDRKDERWRRKQTIARGGDRSLIAARERAGMDKNWQEADRIRDELSSKGVVIEDTPGGTVWKVK